ncbi:MAG: hypothetical protein Q9168_006399 [Polycauliona sp. 1 TL-2023]
MPKDRIVDSLPWLYLMPFQPFRPQSKTVTQLQNLIFLEFPSLSIVISRSQHSSKASLLEFYLFSGLSMSFSSTAETLTNMGNLCSTPSRPCRKRACPFPSIGHHARGRKRIRYTLVPQRDTDRRRRKASALANNHHRNNESPNTLHRSNAIRRPCNSRSQSSSPPHPPRPTRLEIRNVTPPPYRPSSIAPTLMLAGTPSTDPPTSSLSRSSRIANTTSPTTPTTIISSSPAYDYTSSSSSAPHHHHHHNHGPRTLYMVDGEIVGSDEERLELRWIDALRAPGAPGGYRTVVDVVESRRSGRLTVVNAGPGAEEDNNNNNNNDVARLGPHPSTRYEESRDERESDTVNGIFAPQVGGGATRRCALEEEMRIRWRYRRQLMQPGTPVRRKPVPTPSPQISSPHNAHHNAHHHARHLQRIGHEDESPLASRSHAHANGNNTMKAIAAGQNDGEDGHGLEEEEAGLPLRYRRRRAPMTRPPIPEFGVKNVSEKELLDEVEEARKGLEGRWLVDEGEEEVEVNKDHSVGLAGGNEALVSGNDQRKRTKKEEKKEEEEEQPMDFFWVDDDGNLEHKRCMIPNLD